MLRLQYCFSFECTWHTAPLQLCEKMLLIRSMDMCPKPLSKTKWEMQHC